MRKQCKTTKRDKVSIKN